MRRQVRLVATGLVAALLGVAVALMPGCSGSYPFEVRGVVRSAADGTPVAGATVEVDVRAISRSGLPATTAADGSFTGSFRAADFQFTSDQLPRWSATVS